LIWRNKDDRSFTTSGILITGIVAVKTPTVAALELDAISTFGDLHQVESGNLS
jgi:hypothetical protein